MNAKFATKFALLAIHGLFSIQVLAQTIQITTNKTNPAPNEQLVFTVKVDISEAKQVNAISAVINLGNDFKMPGVLSTMVFYNKEFFNLTIDPVLRSGQLLLAVGQKSTSLVVEGSVEIAQFKGHFTTSGEKRIEFEEFGTSTIATSRPASALVKFTSLTGVVINVSGGPDDSDTDGIPDGIEDSLGLNPEDADSDDDGTPDGDEDFDGDGLSNSEELADGLDPTLFIGDINGDRAISGADATRILQFLAGLREQISLGRGPDVSNDGNITGADATRILQILVGLRTQNSVQR